MDDDVFLPTTQQVLALTTLVSALIGTLRVKGLLSEDDVQAVFAVADQLMPDRALPHGPELLAVVRGAQAVIEGDDPRDL